MSESDAPTPTVRDYAHSASLPFHEQEEGGIWDYGKHKIYFLGVIDILTEYNTKKKMEHFFKSLKYGNSISCIPPDLYGARFDEFICSRIVTPDEYKEISKTLTKKHSAVNEAIEYINQQERIVNDDM